jgi:hypothetical protein
LAVQPELTSTDSSSYASTNHFSSHLHIIFAAAQHVTIGYPSGTNPCGGSKVAKLKQIFSLPEMQS